MKVKKGFMLAILSAFSGPSWKEVAIWYIVRLKPCAANNAEGPRMPGCRRSAPYLFIIVVPEIMELGGSVVATYESRVPFLVFHKMDFTLLPDDCSRAAASRFGGARSPYNDSDASQMASVSTAQRR